MQPEVVSSADGGEVGEGIVGAEDSGAGGGVDVEGRVPVGLGFFDLGREGGGEHSAGRVGGDGPDGRRAETEHLGCFLDAVVTVGAGEEDELAVLGGVTVLLRVGEQGVTGDDYRGSV